MEVVCRNQRPEAPRGGDRRRVVAGGRVPARIPGDMVLVAPPDDRRGRGWLQSHRARLQRLRTIRPAAPTRQLKARFLDLVDDLLALLDALSLSKVILVGKDFGAAVIILIYPPSSRDRVQSFITIGVPFMPPRPPSHHDQLPEGFYIKRWKEPGRAEADFGRLDAKAVVRNVYILFSRSEIPIAKENEEIMDLVGPSTPLPSWFTDNDLATYGALYEKSGFDTALQIPYRTMGVQLDIPDPKDNGGERLCAQICRN